MRLPIVAGSLHGRWWLPARRGKTLRVPGGTYEPEQTRLFDEPEPRNARLLRRHGELNRLGNVKAVEAAVADRAGTAHFAAGSGSGTGCLAAGGGVEVRTMRLDDLCDANGLARSAVKMDVEGAETAVLQGARDTLARWRPVLFLSTHGPPVYCECVAALREMGYDLRPIVGRDVGAASELLCTPVEE